MVFISFKGGDDMRGVRAEPKGSTFRKKKKYQPRNIKQRIRK